MRHRPQSVEEVLLVGNPNAGKSTLFNALTGGNAKVGNWHGVTVGVLTREAKLGGTRVSVSDLPGVYSADGMSMEERLALSYLADRPAARVFFVCECSALPRALPLFSALSLGRKCALLLTKRKRFEKMGGRVDIPRLEGELGVPVLSAEGMGSRKLRAAAGGLLPRCARMRVPLRLPEAVYRAAGEELGRTEKLFLNGFFTVPLFLALLALAFFVTFAKGLPGDALKCAVERFFSVTLGNYARRIPSPVLSGLLADGVLGSMGGVLCFLPQIALLFLFLILMEESGLISHLAAISDGFFSKIGLNGRALFSLLMGFGCTAAAIMTTRGLDEKRVQKRVILALPYISCSAKLPVYLTLSASFFSEPFLAVLLLYALGAGLSVAVMLLTRQETPPFVLELAPMQLPRPEIVAKALFFQLKQFIMKLATVILAFFLFSWLLSSFDWSFRFCAVEESMLASLCGGLKFLFAPIGLKDWRIAYAALSGLVAKENVAAALNLFYGGFPFSAASAFAFAVFILTCSPCVSAIAASARELGAKTAILNALLQTGSALVLCYFVYFLLTGGNAFVLLLAIPLCAGLLLEKHAKIHRRRGKLAQKLHR